MESKVSPRLGDDQDLNGDIWDEDVEVLSANYDSAAIKEFEDKVIDSSYAISPLKPLSHFLNLGTLVGVFPAESGDRKIRFALTFSIKIIWAIFFTLLWMAFGVGIGTYCCMFNDTASLSTVFQVKN